MQAAFFVAQEHPPFVSDSAPIQTHVAVGVGGYASVLCFGLPPENGFRTYCKNKTALRKNKPQTCRKSHFYLRSVSGMEAFFPPSKIVLTGNPIRSGIRPASAKTKEEALRHFGLSQERKPFVVGGSLGAGTLNKCIEPTCRKLKNTRAGHLAMRKKRYRKSDRSSG